MQSALRGQVILRPDESAVSEPAAVVEVAMHADPASASRRPEVPVGEDAIITDRFDFEDGVFVRPPSREVFAEEGRDLVTAVAWPGLRKSCEWGSSRRPAPRIAPRTPPTGPEL